MMRPSELRDRGRVGRRGEELAIGHLEGKGFQLVERNYRFERGEIDVVMKDGPELVFVEVKARRSSGYGSPEDSVTPHKRMQLRKVAEGFLFERNIENTPCRFDVVTVRWGRGGPEFTHIENAF